MPFNIRDFSAEINKNGISNPSYFMVIITLPEELTAQFPEFGRTAQFRIEQASLPSRTVLTHDQLYYGPIRRIPYGFASMDMNLTVILSEDMREREIFLRWQDMMVGNSRTRVDGEGGYPVGIFDAGYYDDAIRGASVELRTYGVSGGSQGRSQTLLGEITDIASALGVNTSQFTRPFGFDIGLDPRQEISSAYTVRLIEPFPLVVEEVPLSWSNGSDYSKLQIRMQYRYTKDIATFAAPNSGLSIGGLIRSGANLFNRFRPTASFVRSRGLNEIVQTIGGNLERSIIGGI